MPQNGKIYQSKTNDKFIQKSAIPVVSTLFHSTKTISILSALLLVSCATAPSGDNYDSPIGEWTEHFESSGGGEVPSGPDGMTLTSKLTIIDKNRATYSKLNGRVEFYEIDEQGRWKGYWIHETMQKYFLCPEEKGGSPFWGEIVYQFNETYNQYTGTWDKCGEGKKYAISGVR
jgi:hypothetical protein